MSTTTSWRTCTACSRRSMVSRIFVNLQTPSVPTMLTSDRTVCSHERTLHAQLVPAAKERIVGFYSSGPKIRETDLQIDELFRRFCPDPVVVIIGASVALLGSQWTYRGNFQMFALSKKKCRQRHTVQLRWLKKMALS